jgi:hypothetical protein
MDEEELELYLGQIDAMAGACEFDSDALREQLRDDDHNLVPGCYRIIPAPVM